MDTGIDPLRFKIYPEFIPLIVKDFSEKQKRQDGFKITPWQRHPIQLG
jgi:hypothetical protein